MLAQCNGQHNKQSKTQKPYELISFHKMYPFPWNVTIRFFSSLEMKKWINILSLFKLLLCFVFDQDLIDWFIIINQLFQIECYLKHRFLIHQPWDMMLRNCYVYTLTELDCYSSYPLYRQEGKGKFCTKFPFSHFYFYQFQFN